MEVKMKMKMVANDHFHDLWTTKKVLEINQRQRNQQASKNSTNLEQIDKLNEIQNIKRNQHVPGNTGRWREADAAATEVLWPLRQGRQVII